mmetsp:Transcript_46488/g.113220  ORF Transcript_46488/g.113220 Transcript_46488/m.113220 type:complete len:516 (+) Transcript_46488:50-1597(+)
MIKARRRRRRRRLLPTLLLLLATVHVLWDVLHQDRDENYGTMMRREEGGSHGRMCLLPLFVMAADIFMMGNSYTSANSLPTMVRDLFRGGAGDDADDNDGGDGDGADSGSNNCDNNNAIPTATDATVLEQQQQQQQESKTTTIDVQAPGGWKIYQHANQITNSNSTHSQMLNAVTRFAILQDQSQVPSCTCFGDEQTMNMEGVRTIRASTSSDVDLILFMTWGRLEYDNNLQFNNCFSEMQNNLRIGYESYRDNGRRQQLVNDGDGNEDDDRKNIYIAPVGYAFKYIHDNELCSHNITVSDAAAATSNISTTIVEGDFSLSLPPPTCANPGVNNGLSTDCLPVTSSTVFASLYSSDGSHPQLGGSYLAACVLYTTMTGKSPIGRWGPTTELISAAEILQFQQIAHKIVIEDYYNLGYDYPWQRNMNNTACTDSLPANTTAPVVVSTTNLPSPQTTAQAPGATINDQPITATENDTPNGSSSLATSKRILRSWSVMQGAILTVLFLMLLQQIMLKG